jgi:hypothetical protein
MEGVHLAKGGNILEYKVKVNALSKPRHCHPSFMLALKGLHTFKHKRKEEKTCPWKFMRKSERNSWVSIKNGSRDMEDNLSNKF